MWSVEDDKTPMSAEESRAWADWRFYSSSRGLLELKERIRKKAGLRRGDVDEIVCLLDSD